MPTTRVIKAIVDQLNSKEQLALSLSGEDSQLRKFLKREDGFQSIVETTTAVLRNQIGHEYRGGSWTAAATTAQTLLATLSDRTELMTLASDPDLVGNRILSERVSSGMRRSVGEVEWQMTTAIVSASIHTLARLIKDHAPWFVAEAVAELLKTQRQGDEGPGLAASVRAADTQALWAYTNGYLRRLHQRVSTLDLVGIDLRDVSHPYPLAESFLNLTLAHAGGHLEISEPDQVLRAGECAVIVGEPGSGKSTIMQWLAMQLVQAHRSSDAPVPIIVYLRDYDALPEIEKLGDAFTDGLLHRRPTRWAEDFIETGRCVLLLDGFDEVRPELRTRIVAWIEELLRDHGRRGLRIAVSTRPHAALQLGHRLDFVRYDVEPMVPAEIERFIARWWDATSSQRSGDRYVSLVQLKRRILENSVLADLARNPLLLAILCSLYCVRTRRPSTNRVDLYDDVTSMLLRRRDAERNIAGRLSLRHAQVVAQKVAITFVERQASKLPRDDVYDVGRSIQRSIPRLAESSHIQMIDELLERSYIIRALPPQHDVDFWHNSFKEYLAACEVRDEARVADLMQEPAESASRGSADDDAWAEVRHWACAVLGPTPTSQILEWLIDRAGAAGVPHVNRAPWFREALICGDYATAMDPRVAERLAELVDCMLASEDRTSTQAWLRVGESALEMLIPALSGARGVARQVAAARIAAAIGGDESITALGELPAAIKVLVADGLLALWKRAPEDEVSRRLIEFSAPRATTHARLSTVDELIAARRISPCYAVTVAIAAPRDLEKLRATPPMALTPQLVLTRDLSLQESAELTAFVGGAGSVWVLNTQAAAPATLPGWFTPASVRTVQAEGCDLELSQLKLFAGIERLVIRSRVARGDLTKLSSVRWAAFDAITPELSTIPPLIERLKINWPQSDFTRSPRLERLDDLELGPSSEVTSLEGIEVFPALRRLDLSQLPEAEHIDLTPLEDCQGIGEVVLPAWTDLSRVVVPESLDTRIVADEEGAAFGLPSEAQEEMFPLIPERWSDGSILEAVNEDELERRGWTDYLWFDAQMDHRTAYEKSLDEYIDGRPQAAIPGDDASVDLTISTPNLESGERVSIYSNDRGASPVMPEVDRDWPQHADLLALLDHLEGQVVDSAKQGLGQEAAHELRALFQAVAAGLGGHDGVEVSLQSLKAGCIRCGPFAWRWLVATAGGLDLKWVEVFTQPR